MNGAPIMCELHVMYSGTKITKKHAAFSQEPQSSIKKHANMLHCNVTFIHSSHSLGCHVPATVLCAQNIMMGKNIHSTSLQRGYYSI